MYIKTTKKDTKLVKMEKQTCYFGFTSSVQKNYGPFCIDIKNF